MSNIALRYYQPKSAIGLYSILSDIGKEKGFIVVQSSVGKMDHVHCFVQAPPTLSITQIVKYLKGISGNKLYKRVSRNKKIFMERIRKYIERQKM